MYHILKINRYEIIAALCGGVVMILELVGARMMAPYFGTSTYVWTAMIGVILGALSIGYWYGGRLADRGATDKALMMIIVIAALCIALTMWIRTPVLALIAQPDGGDVRIQALLAGLLLFAPAAVLLGIVSPYVAKLKISSLKTAGASIGKLYAAGTLGSIIGTFLAGYWLISALGNFHLGILLVVVLVIVSFIAERQTFVFPRLFGAVAAIILLSMAQGTPAHVVSDTDSAYARYQVVEQTQSGNQTRYLMMDNLGVQSGIDVTQPDRLIFSYTQAFQSVMQGYGVASNVLVIGGGAYTFPRWAAEQSPRPQVDVVEIDPALDELAKKYFAYDAPQNVRIIHDDGRIFLNKNSAQYDLIYVDAFASLTPPFHLATVEATKHLSTSLKNDGVVAVNVVSSATLNDPYFSATYHTYRQLFPRVVVYQTQDAVDLSERQNLLFLMGNEQSLSRIAAKLRLTQLAPPETGMILTDDHAPVEQLIQKAETL